MSIHQYSPAIIAQTTIQIITSSLSAICSTTLAVMILRSNTHNNTTTNTGRMNTPYKRYVLGMCLADTCQSLALMAGPFMVPKEMKFVVGLSSGNMNSCNVNGFFLTFGILCNLFYLFALMLSYLSKIKYNLSNQTFLKKYDKTIHVVALGYTIFCSTFLVASKSINSADRAGFCYVLQSPMDCGADCRGYDYRLYAFLLFVLPIALLILGIIVCMFVIVHHVKVTDQITQHRTGAHNEMMNSDLHAQDHVDDRAIFSQKWRTWLLFPFSFIGSCKFLAYLRSTEDNIEEDSHDVPSSQILIARAARRNRKLATTSALLYTSSVVLIYFIPITSTITQLVTQRRVPTVISIMQLIFSPLGGLMFIFAHTWQKVSILHRRNTGCSWIRAFVSIILAGGELPPASVNDGNRNEAIPLILLQESSPPRKWYDLLGLMRDRADKAKVKKRFKKKAGYVVRRRLSDQANDDVSPGMHQFKSGNLEDINSISGPDPDSDVKELEMRHEEEKEDCEGLSQTRLQLWNKNGKSKSRTSSLEISMIDIHKKYSVDVFCDDSDSASE